MTTATEFIEHAFETVEHAFESARAHAWTATGHEAPVFYDHRGRRRHWVAAAGALVATLAVIWICGLVVGPLGFTSLRAPNAGVSGSPLIASPVARGSHTLQAVRLKPGVSSSRDNDSKL